MNKAELVAAVAEKAEISKKDAEAAARVGRNPQTKQEITIPASKAPKFKAGKALKDSLN